MKNKPKLRFAILAAVLLAMMAGLLAQLGSLTIVHGAEYAEKAVSRKNATTYTTGARGRILDRNGVPLAYDETSYNVQFWRDPERLSEEDSARYTESLIRTIEIIEAGGGEVIDTSYIQKNEETGQIEYQWGVTAESSVRARYKNYCDAMGFSIPREKDAEGNVLKDKNGAEILAPMSEWISAEKAYLQCRESWQIPNDLPFEEAIKIMSIRQEVNLNKWRAYEPVTIAFDVSLDVVAQLDMLKDELPGIETQQSTTRVYPWGNTASHILGYVGRQVTNEASLSYMNGMGFAKEDLDRFDYAYSHDAQGNLLTDSYGKAYTIYDTDGTGNRVVNMTRLGYSYNDFIGLAGVERTMERYLTASTSDLRGTQSVEINKYRNVIRKLENTPPTDGNDVMLTIDLNLQRVAEQALKDSIAAIRAYEEAALADPTTIGRREDYYTRRRADTSTIQMAESGAVVVLEVDTGDMLAMASYPDYDPNVFLSSISDEDFQMLFGEGSNQPTLNRAIASRLAPGSIFKLATGLAGLMEGVVKLDEKIQDEGPYDLLQDGTEINQKDAPNCWTDHPEQHNVDLKGAITVSCNYYFFTLADRMGIAKLNDWAERLGLSTKTGIELPGELSGHIGGQEVLYDNQNLHNEQKSSLPNLVYRQMVAHLRDITVAYRGIQGEDEAIARCAERLLQLQDGEGGGHGDQIREILREELAIPINISSQRTDWISAIESLLNELLWKPIMTVRAGMGQAVTLVTPVAVPRYAAAFANKGTVYDVHIVDRVTDANGKTVVSMEPTVHAQIDGVPEEYWDTILSGLEGVVTAEDGGTAGDVFSNEFKEKYQGRISGKSGTAQISQASNNVDIENTSWFITLAPREDPEIVIVTCIPYGMSGSRGGATAVEEIITYYIDRIESAANETLVRRNGIVP